MLPGTKKMADVTTNPKVTGGQFQITKNRSQAEPGNDGFDDLGLVNLFHPQSLTLGIIYSHFFKCFDFRKYTCGCAKEIHSKNRSCPFP